MVTRPRANGLNMAAIEEVDREELGKRIDKVIEEFTRRHGRLPSKVQVLAKNGTSDLSRAVDETIASRVAVELLANELRENTGVSKEAAIARIYELSPALYEQGELVVSQHVTQAHYNGRQP
jgi:hypothetical protein